MIKKWNDKIEKAFNVNTQDLSLLESQQTFQLNFENHSLENLSYIHSRISQQNITNVFSQLASFFEMGFLLEKQKRNFAAVQGFAFGQTLKLDEKNIFLNLPKTQLYNVVRTSAPSILKKINYDFLNHSQKMNAFVITISAQHSLLVFSQLAEPWMKLRLESLQKTLMKISFE